MRIPPLEIKILPESSPLKSRILVRRLAEGYRFWGATAVELSYQLSYPSSIWPVWQLYGGWPFGLHTLLFGTWPYAFFFSCDPLSSSNCRTKALRDREHQGPSSCLSQHRGPHCSVSMAGGRLVCIPHTCHILPFQPILWNIYFPPEPAKATKNSPQWISEGGIILQVCTLPCGTRPHFRKPTQDVDKCVAGMLDEQADAAPARSVFKGSIWKHGPSPWEIWTFKGHFDLSRGNGSGIWDPQFHILRIEIMRTDPTPGAPRDSREVSTRESHIDTYRYMITYISLSLFFLCIYIYIYIYI